MNTLAAYRIRRQAFTLIELLVVISIIALLIGILLPALGAARHTARVVTDLTHFQQIKTGVALYSADFDGYYPVQLRESNPRTVTVDEQLVTYTTPYAYSRDQALSNTVLNSNSGIDMAIWASPVDILPQGFGDQKRSYSINIAEVRGSNSNGQNGVSRRTDIDASGAATATTDGYSFRIEDVIRSSDSIDYTPNFNTSGIAGFRNTDGTVSFELLANNRSYVGGPNSFLVNPNRFYGYAGPGAAPGDDPRDATPNMAFADGHAASIRGEELIDPTQPRTSTRSTGESLFNCEKR